MKELKTSIGALQGQVNRLDIRLSGMELDVRGLRQDMKTGFEEVGQNFSSLHSSVDRYFKKTEDWHQEQVILKARHDKVSDSLVKKNILTLEDTIL